VNEDGARFDSGFDDGGPFPVTPVAGGISLESALRDFGPAAIDDLIPRVRAIASALDAAHARGVVHGALHPSKVIIADAATQVIAGSAPAPPHAAPEVAAGGAATAASDQFALAAIVYQWLFGRPISGPAVRPVDVRTMPGVDRVGLSKAFTRALAPRPEQRFESCLGFCEALLECTTPELPFDSERVDASLAQGREESILAGQPDLDAIDPGLSSPPAALASWNPAIARPPAQSSPRFGGGALVLALLVGGVFGFAAGYMARPRALQSAPPQEFATAPGTENEVVVPKAPAPAREASASARENSSELRRDPAGAASGREGGPQAPKAPQAPKIVRSTPTGTLAIESRPAGAAVAINGKPSGKTPLTINDLAPGDYQVTMVMPGYRNFATTVRVVAGARARAAASLTAQENE